MKARISTKGVYAAVLTPLDSDLRPDARRMAAHCRWLFDHGCDGLAPLGTTGEANSLGVFEREKLIGDLADSGLDMGRMIVGTGTPALADTVRLSRAALEAGAGGLLVLPPFYYKEPGEEGLFAYFARLAEALGENDPRIHLYHFPLMSAVPVTLQLVLRLRAAFPGLFVGLKDSGGDFANSRSFIDALDGFDVYSGSEELLLQNLEAGGAGGISATTNVTAPLASAVLAAWRKGNFVQAAAAQDRATRARRAIAAFPVIAALKAIVARSRGDDAWLRLLPPQVALAGDQAAQLFEALDGLEVMGGATG
ncbi:MAG: dihydrodipicolinate synthase family protein [Rhodobiaceae bacterium]|nr:dihydrodipicolinate synthase family protein [Rhodobiaceae bacterium]